MKLPLPWLIAALALPGAALFAHPSPEHKIEELEQHLRDTPGDVELRISYASQLRKMQRFDDAENALRTVDLVSPAHPGVSLERAQIAYYRGNDVMVAESLAQALLRKHPRYAEGWNFLGQLQRKAGRIDDAIDSGRRYLALTKEYRAGDFTDLATLLSNRNGEGDKEEAVQVLDQGLAKVGELAGMHLMAAGIEASLQRYEAASRRFDKLAARYRPRPDWSRQKGEILVRAGRYQEAATAFDSALAMIQSMPPERQEDPEVRKLILTLKDAKQLANENLQSR